MSLRVRPAAAADAPAIAAVHVATWAFAYRDVLPASALAAQSVSRREAQWQQWLVPGAPAQVFVAVDRSEIVGFAAAGASRDAGAGPRTGELFALYVRPDRWGSAAGRGLWAEASVALARAGYREATLWVLDQNPRARRFYEREGAALDGGRKTEPLLGVPVDELRYRAPLSARAFAEGLAAALNRLDEGALARFLDPEVTWAGGGGFGPDGVLSAIRARAAAPPDALSSFTRESVVTPISADRYRVQVSDRMRSGGHAHTWRHALALTIPAGRGVVNAVPLDLPGEPARLAAFLRRIGVYA